MKKFLFGLFAGALIIAPALALSAPNFAEKLKGKILLAVEDKGKTYYVANDGYRYRITAATAQKVFEKLALGISNANLSEIQEKDLGIVSETSPDIRTVYQDKVVEKIVYQDKIVEKIVYVNKCDTDSTTQSTPTQNQVQNNSQTSTTQNEIPAVNPYSDYNFSYTYATEYPKPEWMKVFRIAQTSRDLRLKKAIFKINDQDAEKYLLTDIISNPPALYYCTQQCKKYILEKTDKNTFSYFGDLPVSTASSYFYLDLSAPSTPEGRITNISLPVANWEIWDQTIGKQVKTN